MRLSIGERAAPDQIFPRRYGEPFQEVVRASQSMTSRESGAADRYGEEFQENLLAQSDNAKNAGLSNPKKCSSAGNGEVNLKCVFTHAYGERIQEMLIICELYVVSDTGLYLHAR